MNLFQIKILKILVVIFFVIKTKTVNFYWKFPILFENKNSEKI